MHPADTSLTPVDLGSYSSRVTLMCGMAAIQAADAAHGPRSSSAVATKLERRARARWSSRERKVGRARRLGQGGAVRAGGRARRGHARRARLPGSYAPPKRAGKFKGGGVGPSPCYSYSACVVELTVDEETGQVDLEDVWIAHDIGRALNPLLVEGQVEGSVYMGIGEALDGRSRFSGRISTSIPRCSSTRARPRSRRRRSTPSSWRPTTPRDRSGPRRPGRGRLLPVIPAIANAIHRRARRFASTRCRSRRTRCCKALELQARGQDRRVSAPEAPAADVQGADRGRVGVRPAGRRRRPSGPSPHDAGLPPFTYFAPRTVDAAARLMTEHGRDAMLVAGGTDLYPNMKRRQFEPKIARRRSAGSASCSGVRRLVRTAGPSAPRRRCRRSTAHPEYRARLSGAGDGGRTCVFASAPATWVLSGATCAWTRAATTTISPTSGGRRSASA